MNTYIVHNTGGWIRNDANTAATREPATVQEFTDFEDMHPFDRAQFVWMLEHGEVVTSTGSTVYQIRRAK